MNNQLQYTATQSDHGQRIDKFLTDQLENYTRSFIQKLIQDHHVLVNDKTIKPNYKIRENDKIIARVPEIEEPTIQAENIPLDIIYEDNDILIVNKEAGMVVHPATSNYSGTLVNALLYSYKDNLSQINGDTRPGIVHRIDKDTSGLLMIAKNDKTHQCLSKMLKKRSVLRKYQAIVFGNLKEDSGTINEPIGRHPIDRKRMAVTYENSREAITHYQLIEQFKGFAHIEATLETGRTHQIRVHMKHMGHPILGDPVYGPRRQPYDLKGQLLHAKTLGFIHPTTNVYMEFNSELPSYFLKTIDKLRYL